MFADKETIIADVLVFIFLAAVCTIVYGYFTRDVAAVGIGAMVLLLFFCLLWVIKHFRKH